MDEKVLVKLREEQTRITSILKAIEALEGSAEWKTMKELMFDGLVERLKQRIHTEAMASEVSQGNLYRLQGELKWAKKYADLKELASTLKAELEAIRKRIQ